MTPIRICIIDDEKLARRAIATLLSDDSSVTIVGEAGDGNSAVRLLREQRPDLVFLDVKMPKLDGFGILSQLGSDAPRHVVFVTAYDSYAVKAFGVEAIDYLLKPFDDETFYRVLNRAKQRIAEAHLVDYSARLATLAQYLHHGSATTSEHERDNRLAIKIQGEIRLLDPATIDWIGAAEHYAEIHVGTQTHLVRENISQLEQRLNPRQFFRIHRSAIVNIARIRKLSPASHGDYMCELDSGDPLRVSRTRAEALKRLLNT